MGSQVNGDRDVHEPPRPRLTYSTLSGHVLLPHLSVSASIAIETLCLCLNKVGATGHPIRRPS